MRRTSSQWSMEGRGRHIRMSCPVLSPILCTAADLELQYTEDRNLDLEQDIVEHREVVTTATLNIALPEAHGRDMPSSASRTHS
ncbi:hypothetical protein JZ751_009547 [Albula glossodonta]|uniref:Uncharacterized protein n=1 Tax=Albula glossodonta TaxID=121402 RepID=A0A8T2P8Q2_9TELE|nr:hypothetical protein JZ751_009547 [Albula glossodonta]